MIPKIIHYIWLGSESNKSDIEKRCIESWYTKLSDYTIICHNESTEDLSDSLIIECLNNRKYAFASDLLRLKILKDNPGIYLDTDFEILKPFSDEIMSNKAFIGCEHSKRVATGLIAVDHTNDDIINEILDWYSDKSSSELVYNPEIFTKIMNKRGFTSVIKYPKLIDNWMIYPQEYFYPINYYEGHHRITKNTMAIHNWVGSALDNQDDWRNKIDKIFDNNKESIERLKGGLL